ncbi:MAG: polysaccharide deacetylase family protein [Halobacteriota archaeon]
MPKNQIAVRIDVDSTRDVAYLPQLLDLLERLNIQATFFVATGPDKVALNIFKYLTHPRLYLRFLKSRPLRYGLYSFKGLVRTSNVEDAYPLILRSVSRKHEVGLHGYDHYAWMNTLQDRDDETIGRWINRGAAALEAITNVCVKSFASPGFTVTDGLLRVIDSFCFDYSSDFKSGSPMPPFYPDIDGKTSRVLQVPVSMSSIGELLNQGIKKEDILPKIRVSIDMWHRRGLPFVLYIHPSYEVGYEARLFSAVLEEWANDPHITFKTLAQIAQEWKVRL